MINFKILYVYSSFLGAFRLYSIYNGVDLNELGFGIYYSPYSPTVAQSSNKPFEAQSGDICVVSYIYRLENKPMGFQICLQDYNSSIEGIYIRKCSYYHGWSAWSKII